ncbi:TPA: DUF616 domain-containing protein [Bacillus cereus]|nr:DUF616 domain-containing protein [Bacillus cereus]
MNKPCNLLIFGLGKDSTFWHTLNSQGKTIFIEDNPWWYQHITNQSPHLNAILTHYDTKLKDARILLNKPEQLHLSLPSSISEIDWDVIFVDGPNGYDNDTPGRMKSIYMAATLALKSKKTYVLVHDCNREIEKLYCDYFLHDKNLIRSKGKMRRYLIESKTDEKNEFVVYTAITNRYDRLKEISYPLDYVDYIVFTDDKNLKSETWDVLPIEDYQGDPVRTVKQYKILAHQFLKDYKYSVWIDGSFKMEKDIQPLLINYSSLMATVKHPSRNCIYEEMDVCSFYKIDAPDKIQKQKELYLSLGYPKDYGLIASGLLFREHNHPKVIAVMEDWWNEVKNYSKRDQLSFNYSAWKNNFTSQSFEWDELVHYFSIHPHIY